MKKNSKTDKEIANLKKQLAEAMKPKEVEIEVGGDHGDGNVELVVKSRGVHLTIKDWDNSVLPDDADEQDSPEPQVKEWEAELEV